MMSGHYSVTIRATAADVPDLLWQAFPADLEGRWWYESLERCGIEDQFRFAFAVVSDDGGPVGLAPLFVMDVPLDLVLPPALLPLFRAAGRVFSNLRQQRTLFIGSPCADEGTVVTRPGADRRAVLAALDDALRPLARDQRAVMTVWKDFPDADRDDLTWLAKRSGYFVLASFPGTEAPLPATGRKEDYFAAMKASRRHQFRKKLKRSAAAVDLRVQVLQRPSAAVMDEVFALFWQTFEKATTKFERLNRRFFDLLAQRPESHFVLLRDAGDGALVAFMLCFALDGRMVNKFIGIDYARPKEWLLYFRLWEAALDWSLEQGFSSIQSGQSGYAPKIEMGHALVPLTNYCRHRNRLVHWVYGRIARTITWQTLDPDLERYLAAHPEDKPTG
jgi:hypothetical protein